MRHASLSIGTAMAAAALATLVPGCNGQIESTEPGHSPPVAVGAGSSTASPPPALPRNAVQLGTFIGTVDRGAHTLTFAPAGGAPTVLDDHFQPMSQDPVPIDQNGGGTCGSSGQPCNSVDLVSTGCTDGGAGGTFSCEVTMRSFYTARSIPNVYLQVTAVSLTGYDGSNSDTDTTYSPVLSKTLGLWAYSNGSTNGPFLSANDGSNGGDGVICTEGEVGACSGEQRLLEFKNKADKAVSYTFTAWTSLGFSTYTRTSGGNTAYTAICSGAGGSGANQGTTSQTGISLPFDFTVYSVNYAGTTGATAAEINLDANGEITFGTTALDTTPGDQITAAALPNTTAPHPAFFPFWDYLTANTTNANVQMCTETIGSAPNRKFGIEWYNFDFDHVTGDGKAADGPNKGSALDFETFLFEGTGEIDTVYNSMVLAASGTANREEGTRATVGIQDSTGTIATAQFELAKYGTGKSYAYAPSP